MRTIQDTDTAAHDGVALAVKCPGEPRSRPKVGELGIICLIQRWWGAKVHLSQARGLVQIYVPCGPTRRAPEFNRRIHVITQPKVEHHLLAGPPVVLNEN